MGRRRGQERGRDRELPVGLLIRLVRDAAPPAPPEPLELPAVWAELGRAGPWQLQGRRGPRRSHFRVRWLGEGPAPAQPPRLPFCTLAGRVEERHRRRLLRALAAGAPAA